VVAGEFFNPNEKISRLPESLARWPGNCVIRTPMRVQARSSGLELDSPRAPRPFRRWRAKNDYDSIVIRGVADDAIPCRFVTN
jgi:hypothetical protein